LTKAGLSEAQAERWQSSIERGAVLVGVHTAPDEVATIQSALEAEGAAEVAVARWDDV
jgi:hypothetical protein